MTAPDLPPGMDGWTVRLPDGSEQVGVEIPDAVRLLGVGRPYVERLVAEGKVTVAIGPRQERLILVESLWAAIPEVVR